LKIWLITDPLEIHIQLAQLFLKLERKTFFILSTMSCTLAFSYKLFPKGEVLSEAKIYLMRNFSHMF